MIVGADIEYARRVDVSSGADGCAVADGDR